MAKYYLGLDNGGSKVKAAIYDTSGGEVAVSNTLFNPTVKKGGIVERDSETLWQKNVKVIKNVISKSGVDPHDIVGVAACGHGNGVYMIDENGKPTAPGIISTDTRAADIVRGWIGKGVQSRIIPKTKQILWAGQPVAIIAWFKENEPQVLEKTRWALACKDYIRYCLTGQAFGEITDMSAINAMDLQTKEYDDTILNEFGIGEYKHLLPPLKLSVDICGQVTKKTAEETGLVEGTNVVGGLFDCAACALAVGVTSEEKISVIAGTWSINSFISKVPVYSEDLFMTSFFCMDGYYLTTEGSMTSAGNLEWFISNFLHDNELIKIKGNVYDYCNNAVNSLSADECSVIFLPFLFGTNVNPDAKACFMGIDGSQKTVHMIRAIYEGVVFSHMMHIEKLLEFRDKPSAVRISGGATESKVWVQIFADVLQLPIEVSAAKELGTLGCA
ncbi:MAG: carbohydrate kinase, partial [Clostridia bacterium]|nr:carbohydrate kinase [Clostridia bacterium]